jgi:uncharacterized protein (TIRG00374 family)
MALLVMFMLIKNVQADKILRALGEAKIGFFVLTLILLLPNVYIQYFKWNYLLKLIKPRATFFESISSLLAGFTFGFITPGRLGEFGRAFFVKDCPWIKVVGLAVIDKLYSVTIVILLGAGGMLFVLNLLLHHFFIFLPIFIFTLVALTLMLYLVFHPDFIRSFLYNINIMLPFRKKIKLLISSLDNFHKPQALTLLGLSLLFYTIFFTQFYLLTLAFEWITPWDAFVAISSTLLVKSLLPISLGDLGVRESAAVFFFSQVGVLKTTAFNASIMLFLINILIPSLVGLILILKNKLNLTKSS